MPRLHEPHSFDAAWVRATRARACCGTGYDNTCVLIVKSGRWEVTVNDGEQAESVELRPQDGLSVLPASWRSYRLLEPREHAATDGTGELLVVNGGDAWVRLEWAPGVVETAFGAGSVLDPNGLLAPVAVMVTATEDD